MSSSLLRQARSLTKPILAIPKGWYWLAALLLSLGMWWLVALAADALWTASVTGR